MDVPVVRLLGTPAVAQPQSRAAFPAAGYSLLALLAATAPEGCARGWLAGLLWPSSADAQARAALRQLVRRVGLSLGEDALQRDGADLLRIPRPELTDLSLIRSLLRAGDVPAVIRAFGLVSGPLLSPVRAEDGAFALWLADCRRDLNLRLLAGGTEAIQSLTRYGACDVAQLDILARGMLGLAPENPGVRQIVEQAYARIGEASHAAAVLGVAPTVRVAARAISLPVSAPPWRPGAAVPRLALFCPVGQGEAEVLGARIVAELAACLTVWRSFAVLAPFSSFAVQTRFGIPTDNSLLRADYAVSGEVQGAGTGQPPQLQLQMTHLSDRHLLWSGSFALDGAQIGAGMSRFAARVAATLAGAIETHRHAILRKAAHPSALLHFLDGRAQQARCDLPHVRRARSCFLRALGADDQFAPAHARIAETLFVEWILCGGNDAELLSAARLRADLSVRLDPAGATGHWVQGAVALYQRRFDRVAECFAEAESLAPNDADMLLEYADALSHLGDHGQAEARFAQALDLNPLPPDKLWWVGASVAFHAQDFATAARRFDHMRDAEIGVGLRAAAYAQAGRLPEARRWARRLKQTLPGLTAEELCAISPNQETETYRRAYIEGLRLAAFS